MKKSSHGFLFFLFFASLLVFSTSAARLLLPQNQGGKEKKVFGFIGVVKASNTATEQDFSNLMGAEECGEEDEDCLKRRMIADAHLDYIYTQHHKKP